MDFSEHKQHQTLPLPISGTYGAIPQPNSQSYLSSSPSQPQQSTTQPYSQWCSETLKQVDEMFDKSENSCIYLFQPMLTMENVKTTEDVVKVIHNFSKLTCCWSMLFLKETNSSLAQREFNLGLTHLQEAAMHFTEGMNKANKN